MLGCAAGNRRAVSDLEPRPRGDPAAPARLEHPPERRLLPRLPGRHARRHRDRAVADVSRATGSGSSAASAGRCATVRSGPTTTGARLGLAAGGGNASRRAPRPAARAPAAHAVRLAGLGRGLPDRERRPAARSSSACAPPAPGPGDYLGDSDARIAKLSWRQAIAVGTAQAAALVPGISRSGITMGGGLLFGLSNEDAARYAFLLATPIIGAAGVLKLPDLFGSAGDGVRGPALVGRPVRRRDHLLRGQVPASILRDQPADAVRRLLHRRRPHLHADLRPLAAGSHRRNEAGPAATNRRGRAGKRRRATRGRE